MQVKPETSEKAVNELLHEDTPEAYEETLELFFESWLTSDLTDGTTGKERSKRYSNFKATKRFLKNLK